MFLFSLFTFSFSIFLSHNINQRLIITSEYYIFYCLFSKLGNGVSEGGAIYKSGSSLFSLISNSFKECTAQNSGGALFISGGTSIISKNCFFLCFIRVALNNYFGNCFKINGYSNCNFSSSYLCGYSYETCSDSTFYFSYYSSTCNNINSTNCNGIGGASAIMFDYISSLSKISFLNLYKGKSYHSWCFRSSSNVKLEYINMINHHSTVQQWWASSSTMTVSNCYIFNCIFNEFSTTNKPSFSNSYSDLTLSGFTKTLFLTYNLIPILYEDCKYFKFSLNFYSFYNFYLNFLIFLT